MQLSRARGTTTSFLVFSGGSKWNSTSLASTRIACFFGGSQRTITLEPPSKDGRSWEGIAGVPQWRNKEEMEYDNLEEDMHEFGFRTDSDEDSLDDYDLEEEAEELAEGGDEEMPREDVIKELKGNDEDFLHETLESLSEDGIESYENPDPEWYRDFSKAKKFQTCVDIFVFILFLLLTYFYLYSLLISFFLFFFFLIFIFCYSHY